jgi:hypothetical protein
MINNAVLICRRSVGVLSHIEPDFVNLLKEFPWDIPAGNKENKFDITARMFGGSAQQLRETRLTFTLSPYRGWTLTKDGELIQGRTGYLIDENDLYILEDGRRVSGEKDYIINGKDLRVGDVEAGKGLRNIFGIDKTDDETPIFSDSKKIQMQHKTIDLLREYGTKLPLVVYQAFQINICYKGAFTAEEPFMIDNSSGAFYSIGTDETGIPIVVTRVGQVGATKKLVIAGPHGDERSAQRLIMMLQKHFIQHGPPLGTVIYFIPSISPTMTFADARGIPLVNEAGEKVDKTKRINGSGMIDISIPQLHDLVAALIPPVPPLPPSRIRDDRVLRSLIQNQKTPHEPPYGVDSNRDVEQKLKSSKVFRGFIDWLNEQHRARERNYTEIHVKIYDPKFANPNVAEEVTGSTIDNFRVLMIHGYDKSQPGGCVYGPYYVSKNETIDLRRPARMSLTDQIYVNYIRDTLGWNTPGRRLNYESDEIKLENLSNNGSIILSEYLYLYLATARNAKPFEGEWSWYFTDKGIWAADIELRHYFDEGVRGHIVDRKYENQMNNINRLRDSWGQIILSQFTNLVCKFPW